MSGIITDTRFFTNEQGKSLVDRFKTILNNARFFDVLVGFFRVFQFLNEKTMKGKVNYGILCYTIAG